MLIATMIINFATCILAGISIGYCISTVRWMKYEDDSLWEEFEDIEDRRDKQ